eukprot:1653589-Pyramimonas_sp.AAC.1
MPSGPAAAHLALRQDLSTLASVGTSLTPKCMSCKCSAGRAGRTLAYQSKSCIGTTGAAAIAAKCR